MGSEKELRLMLAFTAVVMLILSYAVGYIVGKGAGFQEAKIEFEAEKQKLMETLAEISPVSRPVEREVVEVKPQATEEGLVQEPAQPVPPPVQQQSVKEKPPKAQAGSGILEGMETLPPKPEQSKEKPREAQAPAQPAKSPAVKGKEEKKPKKEPAPEKVQEQKAPPTEKPSVQKKQGNFYLQIGIFRSKKNVEKLLADLKTKGYNATVVPTGRRGYEKVIVGYFETRKDALAVMKKLRKDGYRPILKRRKG
jgi:cell division protein FtsN